MNAFENWSVKVESRIEIEIAPPNRTLPGHRPYKRQEAAASGSNVKPSNPIKRIVAMDEMAASFKGLMIKIKVVTAEA